MNKINRAINKRLKLKQRQFNQTLKELQENPRIIRRAEDLATFINIDFSEVEKRIHGGI